ncbi:sugar porter family MFS transporter [Mucilaginibacter ginkgonis]|uniref:Sugar porter family MFS transporter n=1 Tax=Mucilaginibacter ginkgonis TaxID=2682091 RepID=A0A6I4IMN7_9SPHI|nr:sugar porter family MFS transporter [Mucilaginibacter ginkgonis]QQL49981.1 sugar porter family MFS transporter [Mucilaginibacter ginkgonis]
MENLNQYTPAKPSRLYLYLVCLVAALGGFLFGFDTAVISGTVKLVKQNFSLNAINEGWFVSCALLGCIVGVAISGALSDKFGRKIVLILSAILFLVSALGCLWSHSFSELIGFRIVGGLGIGVASMVSPLYISEFAPARYRGTMVSLYQLALTIGIVIAYFSNAYLLSHPGGNGHDLYVNDDKNGSWRLMLGLGALPAGVFLLSLLTVPESPRWLLLKGQIAEASAILVKIDGDEAADKEINDFNLNNNTEKKLPLKRLFSREYRRPIIIGLLLPFFSQVCGINAVIYYGPKILEQAGFALNNALGGQVTIGLVNVVFTFVAILTVDKYGRKPLLYVGVGGAVTALIIIGVLFYNGYTSGPWILISILIFIACFAFSFGPVCWVIIGEIFPSTVRGKAMSLATLSLWIGNFLVGQLTPAFLEFLGPAYTFWLFAGCCAPALILTYKLIPETKGLSLEDIETLWSGHHKNVALDNDKHKVNPLYLKS